jgi:hypothetical protein
MLISECEGCRFLHWAIGIGLGVRCTHLQHRTEAKLPIPLISAVSNCTLYEKRRYACSDAMEGNLDGKKNKTEKPTN